VYETANKGEELEAIPGFAEGFECAKKQIEDNVGIYEVKAYLIDAGGRPLWNLVDLLHSRAALS